MPQKPVRRRDASIYPDGVGAMSRPGCRANLAQAPIRTVPMAVGTMVRCPSLRRPKTGETRPGTTAWPETGSETSGCGPRPVRPGEECPRVTTCPHCSSGGVERGARQCTQTDRYGDSAPDWRGWPRSAQGLLALADGHRQPLIGRDWSVNPDWGLSKALRRGTVGTSGWTGRSFVGVLTRAVPPVSVGHHHHGRAAPRVRPGRAGARHRYVARRGRQRRLVECRQLGVELRARHRGQAGLPSLCKPDLRR